MQNKLIVQSAILVLMSLSFTTAKAITVVPGEGDFKGSHFVGYVPEILTDGSVTTCYGPSACDNPIVEKTFVACKATILSSRYGNGKGLISDAGKTGQILIQRLKGNKPGQTFIDFKFIYLGKTVEPDGGFYANLNTSGRLYEGPMVGNVELQKTIKNGCYASGCPIFIKTLTAMNFLVWDESEHGAYDPNSQFYKAKEGHWGMKYDNKTRTLEVFSYGNSFFSQLNPTVELLARCQ
jgi:hypothetical protein